MSEAENATVTEASASDASSERQSNPRRASGVVVSNKMDKTIVVRTERFVKHPIYGKFIRKSAKVHAHDENNECSVGDTVTVIEAPRYSRTKSWKLLSIDERATVV